jgi:hypothetical protein
VFQNDPERPEQALLLQLMIKPRQELRQQLVQQEING